MEAIIPAVDVRLIEKELTADKFIRHTAYGRNRIYEITAHNAPNTMLEIGRLREISFRMAGGGTGKSVDIDTFDTTENFPYRQLIVWDPRKKAILGGYRYLHGAGITAENLSTRTIFKFSDTFIKDYLPVTIELGRSFVPPSYQNSNLNRRSFYALDNLWDGLGTLIVRFPEIKYFFGKVTMYTSYNAMARNGLLYFLHKYFPDPDALVVPDVALDYNADNAYYDHIFNGGSYKADYAILFRELKAFGESIPPLINSYMKLTPNMRVFGTAVNPYFGGVEETGILVSIKDMYPEKVNRHLKPLSNLTARLRKTIKGN